MNDYRVVYIRGQGYGYLTPEDWAEVTALHRGRVHVLTTFDTEPEAQKAYSALPQKWVGKQWMDKPGLHFYNGEWWYNAGKTITRTGEEIELRLPVDRPM